MAKRFAMKDLLKFLSPGPERIGFVLKDGSIVEVENICQDRENGFEFKGKDLLDHLETATASWHTHPDAAGNLTEADRLSFLNYPDWMHYIVGADGVVGYAVEGGQVIRAATYSSPRVAEKAARRPD